MEIAIIGGGLTGLSAAYFLSKNGHSVVVFEKERTLGGLAASFQKKQWLWPLEHYYHHYFTSDRGISSLIRELNLEKQFFFKTPKTSVFLDNKILQFDNPRSILLFPKLEFSDKIRVGFFSLLLKINPFWKPLEKISAVDFIKKTMGEKVFKKIWWPLLQSKFGNFAEKIPASWFWARIKKRSFSLGYFIGGTQTLINSLAKKIQDQGGKIYLQRKISKISKTPEGFELFLQKENFPLKFAKVIATVSPSTLTKISPELSNDEKHKKESLESLGSFCLVFSLKETFLTDGTYWLNVNDSSFPFVAVVEHTNFIDKKYYGNEVILYVGGYYPTDHKLFKETTEEALKQFLPFLKRINPQYDFKKNIINVEAFKDEYSQPVVGLSHSNILPKITTSVPNLYWASLHHVYPEDRGINYAILLGKKVANATS